MSTEANVQLVEKAYADFARGDIPAILAALDPAVEWVIPGDIPTSGTWRGPSEVQKFFQAVGETWDFQAFTPREYIASGDQVVALGSYLMTSRSTGRQWGSEWAMVWTIRNGKVTNFREYMDTLAEHDALAVRATA